MRRLLALLLLTVALSCLVQGPGEAAAPPAGADPTRREVDSNLFLTGVPRNLSELQALEAQVKKVMDKVIPATVGLGGGSGVVVDKDGLIMTVAHVGQKAGRDLRITFPDGKTVKGKTLGNYKTADAGLARITDKGTYPFAEVGKSGTLKPGQWCVAMGYPVSFTRGQKPPVRVGRVLWVTATTVTTDCMLMGGDSGGPLFDLQGRVIGVNSRAGGGATGNMHAAADIYTTHWKELLGGKDWGEARQGRQRRPNPGMTFDLPVAAPPPAPPKIETPARPSRSSGRPSVHERNSEAMRAAFQEAVAPVASSTVRVLSEDKPVALGTIVSADGLIVTKASVLKDKVACVLPGGKVVTATKLGEEKEFDLAVLRVDAKGLKPVSWRKDAVSPQGSLVASVSDKGTALAIGTVTAEPRQFRVVDRGTSSRGTAATSAYLGISVEAFKEGVRTLSITPGSAAEKAGLKAGDVIKKAGDAMVRSADEFKSLLRKYKAGDKLPLVVLRGEKEETLMAVLGRPAAGPPARASYDRWGGGPFSERRFGFGKVLPHDTMVLPGDCGGPLVDTSGRVIGVNIARSLRVATYAVLPVDVERIVNKVLQETKKTASR